MQAIKIKELLPDELRQFMVRSREKHFALIDVRQPQEYAVAHIPGAILIPLMELETRLFDLPADRDLVFYCSSGPRSEIAAVLTAEAELSEHPVAILVGGLLAWDGHKLSDFPRIQVFDQTRSAQDLLTTAMDLEKGAYRFYRALLEQFAGHPCHPTLEHLAQAEKAHARMLHALWKTKAAEPQPFEACFHALPGEILEGGQPLEEVLENLAVMPVDNGIRILEFCLGIEYRAYDLYRNMAEQSTPGRARDHLLAIAQAEKTHMRQLTEAIADLVETRR